MNPTLVRQLTQTFPRLFDYANGLYSFRCGDGWYHLICDVAAQLVDLEPPEAALRVTQVKEKFGGLRFYMRAQLSAVSQRLIEDAEARSFTICEACSAPGTLQHRGGWYRTRCVHHATLDDV